MRSIKKCTDGTYRWVYELNMKKNPALLLKLFRRFGYIGVSLWGCSILLNLKRFLNDQTYARSTARIFLAAILAMYLLCTAGYLIYAKLRGGRYLMVFSMGKSGIRYTKAGKEYDKTRLEEMLNGFGGRDGGSLLAAVGKTSLTEYGRVKTVREHPWSNFIEISASFRRILLFAEGEDYHFVVQYLRERCRSAKFK